MEAREDVSDSTLPDGAGHDVMAVPSFEIPMSRYLSEEGRALTLAMRHSISRPAPVSASVAESRVMQDAAMASTLATMRKRYEVDIVEGRIAGVPVRTITPARGVASGNRERVLINLHGGAFFRGANTEALLESIPVAAVADMKVISVDYRQGPEHRHPAGVVDAVAVYRDVLKTTKAEDVGIYGCSAGGALTAMVVAALIDASIPLPGAVGIFSAGAYGDFNGDPMTKGTWGGDSRYVGAVLSSGSPLPVDGPPAGTIPPFVRAYLSEVDVGAPTVSPAESPELLAMFPPTLVLTGTRAYDMSAAVETHRQLVRNGVDAALHVWDGLGHCFMFVPTLPESQEAYDVIARFFDSRLSRRGRDV